MVLMVLAAVLGNTTNYAIGRAIGRQAFSGRYRFIKVEYLHQTEGWFARHGAMTVLLSRFAPIIRTFAPFVAGVGRMPFGRFQAWNVTGAVAWVGLFVWGGYLVGNIPVIRENFGVVTILVIVISLLPFGVMLLRRGRVAE
jgi:membrane-associated protein